MERARGRARRSRAISTSSSDNGARSTARNSICNCAGAASKTIVLGGIATNFGVELTARQAWEHGYAVVIVEDACARMSAELHAMAVKAIFPRIARVTQSGDLEFDGG